MNRIIYVLLVSLFVLSSCDRNAHRDENGITVSMNLPHEDAPGNVRLWVYKADGALVSEYHYATARELAQQRYALPTGSYVLIAANNLVEPFSAETLTANGVKPYEGLLFTLGDASASPVHAHYGVQSVQVDASKARRTEVAMSRMLAELQFTIKHVSADVVRAEAQMMNAATSFRPYDGQPIAAAVADLGSAAPQNGTLTFERKRLMPAVALAENQPENQTENQTENRSQVRADTDIKTLLRFTFHYKDGSTIACDATAPRIEHGGIYTPEIDFTLLRPHVVVEITDINGWIEGETSGGEILNPSL